MPVLGALEQMRQEKLEPWTFMVDTGDPSEESGSNLFCTKVNAFALICGRMEGKGVLDY